MPQIAEWGFEVPGNSIQATISRLKLKLNVDRAPLLLILEEEKSPLGVAALKIREMEEFPEREYWLGDVFVSPAARGRGLGSQLTEAIAEKAKELGVRELWLQTDDQQSLYSRLGWKETEELAKEGKTCSVMLCKL